MNTVIERPFPWLRVIAAGALGAATIGVIAGLALGTAATRMAKSMG